MHSVSSSVHQPLAGVGLQTALNGDLFWRVHIVLDVLLLVLKHFFKRQTAFLLVQFQIAKRVPAKKEKTEGK